MMLSWTHSQQRKSTCSRSTFLVTRLTSLPAFLGLGIGTEVVAVALLLTLFRRRGWL